MSSSALIVPVLESAAIVESIREKYDPVAKQGVPPHITVLYPFVSSDLISTSTVSELHNLFSPICSFRFTLGKIGTFTHTVYGWLCEDSGHVVGFSMADRSNGEIQVVAIHPSHEGRGIGKTLLGKATNWLFSQGYNEIWLGANPDPNIRAYGFYRKLGWQATGKMTGYDEIMLLQKVEC